MVIFQIPDFAVCFVITILLSFLDHCQMFSHMPWPDSLYKSKILISIETLVVKLVKIFLGKLL